MNIWVLTAKYNAERCTVKRQSNMYHSGLHNNNDINNNNDNMAINKAL